MSPNHYEQLKTLVVAWSAGGLTMETIGQIGAIVDHASNTRDRDLLIAATKALGPMAASAATPEEAYTSYCLANAHLSLLDMAREKPWTISIDDAWQALLVLRKTCRSPGFDALPPLQRSQIQTNHGNLLDTLGRPFSAIPLWASAQQEDHTFGMPMVQQAICFAHLASSGWDDGHQLLFRLGARDALRRIRDERLGLEEHVLVRVREMRKVYETNLGDIEIEPHEHPIGDEREAAYRRWCLKRRLFLNPMNDLLGESTIAAYDPLHLPPTDLQYGVTYAGFMNVIKQEFAAARLFVYEGIEGVESRNDHWSDRGLHLTGTMDYADHSVHLEKVKAGLRLAHSLFDKIAFFLNDYLAVGIPKHKVHFTTLWHEKNSNRVRKVLADRPSWALRGLYSIYLDLRDSRFSDSLPPEVTRAADLRNKAEHAYLKVVAFEPLDPSEFPQHSMFADNLAHVVTTDLLLDTATSVLSFAREAIMLLCFVIRIEEHERRGSDPGPVGEIPLFPYRR